MNLLEKEKMVGCFPFNGDRFGEVCEGGDRFTGFFQVFV